MTEAFAWIGEFVEWFARFIPRISIVKANEAGVRWKYGHEVSRVDPGIRCHLPLVTELETTSTARQTSETGTQLLTTRDKVSCSLSMVIVYRVSDPIAALNATLEYVDTIDDVAKAAATAVVSASNFDDLLKELTGEVADRLLKHAKAELRKFGVRVESVSVATFGTTRALRLLGDT